MLALLLSVGLIAVGVTVVTRRAFDELNREHTDALLAQFQREFARRGSEVVESVKGIADAEPTVRMAIDLSRPNADVSVYVNDAHGVSKSHQLDLLDFVNNDGTIISSQESPARFNYKMEWVTQAGGLAGARRVSDEARYRNRVRHWRCCRWRRCAWATGICMWWAASGWARIFSASLVLPGNMRALLYLNLDPEFQDANLLDANGPAPDADRFAPLVAKEKADPVEQSTEIRWSIDRGERGKVSRDCHCTGGRRNCWACCSWAVRNDGRDAWSGGFAGWRWAWSAVGLLFGLMLSWWGAARVTRPVQKLAEGAQEVADGNWNARVNVRGQR